MLATIDTVDIVGLIAAAVSTALAIFAIWQSMTYFRWSNKAQREADKSADAIAGSVKRLEDLFDRLYSDAFGMLRETHADMRKHMWPDQTGEDEALDEVKRRTEENLSSLRADLLAQFNSSIASLGGDATPLDERQLEAMIQPMIDRAIDGSTQAKSEAVEKTARGRLLRHLQTRRRQRQRPMTASEVLSWMTDQGFRGGEFEDALGSLREDGLIRWSGDDAADTTVPLSADEPIVLTKEGRG